MDQSSGNGRQIGESFLDNSGISEKTAQAYGKQLQGYKDHLNDITKSGDKAKASLAGFNTYLIQNGEQAVKTTGFIDTLKGGIKGVASTALSMVGNAGINMIVGWALNSGINMISDWINRDQIAIEKGQEAQSTIKSSFEEFSNGKTTLNT